MLQQKFAEAPVSIPTERESASPQSSGSTQIRDSFHEAARGDSGQVGLGPDPDPVRSQPFRSPEAHLSGWPPTPSVVFADQLRTPCGLRGRQSALRINGHPPIKESWQACESLETSQPAQAENPASDRYCRTAFDWRLPNR